MTYTVEILRSAQRQLAKIDRKDRHRIITAIRGLASDPRPTGSKKLSGRPAWRIRVGVYRVIYEIACSSWSWRSAIARKFTDSVNRPNCPLAIFLGSGILPAPTG